MTWGECFESMTGVGFTTPIRIRKDMVNGMGVPLSIKGGPMSSCSLGLHGITLDFTVCLTPKHPTTLPLSQVSSSLRAAGHLGLSISALSSLELKKTQNNGSPGCLPGAIVRD